MHIAIMTFIAYSNKERRNFLSYILYTNRLLIFDP